MQKDKTNQSRKWQTENLVLQTPVFVSREQIKHAEVGKGAARELNESHSNEIMYGRVSDPYGDFSPLLLTVLQEDNPSLDWSNDKKLRKQLTKMLQQESIEIMGGVEEKIVCKTLIFRVFGHQHLFQVKMFVTMYVCCMYVCTIMYVCMIV